jgi:ribosome biogenesis GTPase / thiamine phosphate phosphatase
MSSFASSSSSSPPPPPPDFPASDRAALPADWRDGLVRLCADTAMMASIEAAAAGHAGPAVPGRVARAEHSLVTVLTPAGPVRAGLTRREQACAGDYVLLSAAEPVVAEVLPRRSQLVRHAAGNRTEPQTLAANMDEVFVTVAADRDVSLGRIERFLALVWESGAVPVVVLTKGDLLPPGAAAPLLARAAGVAPGADVHLVSAVTGDGVGDLARRLEAGRTAALIGSSGAGKSSLLNALAGAEAAATMRVRDADGKGRHKTAWRELVVLDQGGAVIDTPGLRGLGMWLDETGLDTAFADLTELALGCRFSDCRHATEPGCAVTAAIEAGTFEARRLESYRKLEREAAYVARKADPRARRAQARAEYAITREGAARARHRPRSS